MEEKGERRQNKFVATDNLNAKASQHGIILM